MKASLILKGARALLARRGGWVQGTGTASTPDGIGYCSLWALAEASRDLGGAGGPYQRACAYTWRATGASDPSLVHWNDAPGRRKSEVLRAFTLARAEAEARND